MNDIMVPECTVSKGGYFTIHQRKGTTLVMTRLSNKQIVIYILRNCFVSDFILDKIGFVFLLNKQDTTGVWLRLTCLFPMMQQSGHDGDNVRIMSKTNK